MVLFNCPSFSIDLPEGAQETTSYSFVFPTQARFSPSLVVKSEPVAETLPLYDFVRSQLDMMKKELKNFRVITADTQPDRTNALRARVEWGDAETPFQQTFVFRRHGPRVFILTTTQRAGDYPDHGPMFEKLLASFQPLNGAAAKR